MKDKRTAPPIPSDATEIKSNRGGARPRAGRPELDPADKRKARQIYCTDAGWQAARAHVKAQGYDSLGDWAESLRNVPAPAQSGGEKTPTKESNL